MLRDLMNYYFYRQRWRMYRRAMRRRGGNCCCLWVPFFFAFGAFQGLGLLSAMMLYNRKD